MKNASLYECVVDHKRLKPARKAFSYRVFMLSFDLDEITEVVKKTAWLSHNRWGLFSINDRDHVDMGEKGIKANLYAWLASHDMSVPPETKVRLVAFPRVFGYGFNPVSFYYLSSTSGEPLFAVAEVTNTFREMKLFPVRGADGAGWQRRVAKNFYVSPFSDPGDDFDFKLGAPKEYWRININNLHENEIALVSSVRGKERELTGARLFFYAFKYPLLSIRIIVGIHWQALKLWLAKVPFFKKTDQKEDQKDLMRPHQSLTNPKS